METGLPCRFNLSPAGPPAVVLSRAALVRLVWVRLA